MCRALVDFVKPRNRITRGKRLLELHVEASVRAESVRLTHDEPEMIEALDARIPENGKPFPDRAKMAKMYCAQIPLALFPVAIVAGTQGDVDFMVRTARGSRKAAGGGMAWRVQVRRYVEHVPPVTTQDTPPQANDATCGVACHSRARSRDYVFTQYVTR